MFYGDTQNHEIMVGSAHPTFYGLLQGEDSLWHRLGSLCHQNGYC